MVILLELGLLATSLYLSLLYTLFITESVVKF